MSVKLFFAGAEEATKAYRVMNRLKVRYRLMSFYYLRKKNVSKIEQLFQGTIPSDVVYLIDSGAFTFIETHLKLAKAEPAKWWDLMERYVEEYVEFLSTWRKYIFAAAEMDVDPVFNFGSVWNQSGSWGRSLNAWWATSVRNRLDGSLGYTPPPVAYWRERIQTAGVPVLVSWHAMREWRGWQDQCTKYPYLAIPSGEGLSEAHWFPYINEARKHGRVIHGFAGTKPEWLRRYPFYSADSTSWLMGSKYGHTMIFQNGRLRFYNKENKQVRLRYRWLAERFGLDWKKIEADDGVEVDAFNLIAWIQFASYLTQTPNKDYWTAELNGASKDSLGMPSDLDLNELMHKSVTAQNAAAIEGENQEVDEGEDEPVLPEGEEEPVKKIVEAINEEKRAKHAEKMAGPTVIPMPAPQVTALVQIEKNPQRIGEFIPRHEQVMAPMQCNNCYVQDRCRFYEADASCHFRLTNQFSNPAELIDALRMLMVAQTQRVTHALYQEQLDGGVLDKNLSYEMARLEQSIYGFKEFLAPPQDNLEIKAKGGAVSAILAALSPRGKRQNRAASEAPAQR
jgi:hypothetical protein